MSNGTEVKYVQVESHNHDTEYPPISGSWTMIICTEDESVTNSSTLVSSTYLTMTTQANTNYIIRLRVIWNTSNASADFKYRVRHSGTTTRVRRFRNYAVPSGTSATYPTLGIAATGTVAFDTSDQALTSTAIGGGMIYEDILVQVGASGGTLDFQFAQNTATSGQSVTVYEGSYMEYITT